MTNMVAGKARRACALVALAGIALEFCRADAGASETLTIVEWRRAEVQLYAAPRGQAERRASSTLPPQVDVDAVQDPYYRFVDPRTGEIWYVLQQDVRTNAILPPKQPVLQGSDRQPSCQISAGMNAARSCMQR